MNVLHLTMEDGNNGAGRAAHRLHRALKANGTHSEMWVDSKTTSDPDVFVPSGMWFNTTRNARIAFEQVPTILAGQRGRTQATMAHFGGLSAAKVNNSNADVVNLHWPGFGYMTIEQIGRITKPTVWTMHDMWPILGAEHYAPDGPHARWRAGYQRDNRPEPHHGRDLDRWAWQRKRKSWRTPMQVVAPSQWLADCVASSPITGSWPVTVIPNPIDTEVFKPHDQREARALLGLPMDKPLILFGVIAGREQDRKGWDLLQQALTTMHQSVPDAELVVIGGTAEDSHAQVSHLPTHWLGRLQDDLTLALAYSAATIAVVPSRQDNLPQSATEPQACGCPVVAFNTCGLPSAIEHEVTGLLAQPFDTDDLARAMTTLLTNSELRDGMSRAARQRAVNLWSESVVAAQYAEVYANLLAARS